MVDPDETSTSQRKEQTDTKNSSSPKPNSNDNKPVDGATSFNIPNSGTANVIPVDTEESVTNDAAKSNEDGVTENGPRIETKENTTEIDKEVYKIDVETSTPNSPKRQLSIASSKQSERQDETEELATSKQSERQDEIEELITKDHIAADEMDAEINKSKVDPPPNTPTQQQSSPSALRPNNKMSDDDEGKQGEIEKLTSEKLKPISPPLPPTKVDLDKPPYMILPPTTSDNGNLVKNTSLSAADKFTDKPSNDGEGGAGVKGDDNKNVLKKWKKKVKNGVKKVIRKVSQR